MKIFVYQIYYNDETKKNLLPGFIPLDNTENLRPDWFEFWVMLNFLRNNVLEDDAWYGFLSPKFYEKTGFTSDLVFNTIERYAPIGNVALFSPGWDQLSYFLNPFEQGEVWHPGLIDKTQNFVNNYGLDININKLVSTVFTSVFSNYIIAKKEFWINWMKLSEQFFDYVENNPEYQGTTSYGNIQNPYPMKTFIQERLATLVLSTTAFRVISLDHSLTAPINAGLFRDDGETRRLLQVCDLMKSNYIKTNDEKYLEMYWKIRGDIPYINYNPFFQTENKSTVC